jgi:hypothetical protein
MTGPSDPPPFGRATLTGLTGDPRQFASVRGICLDDGAERGTRALAFSTGGGLDFWALSDRTLDIGPLWFRGLPLAWQHPAGYVSPAHHGGPGADGTGIERALSGFLVTCGLENVRQPAGGAPLHGSLPLTPARIIARGEDWSGGVPMLFAEGIAEQAHLGGPSFRLTRRIEAPIGGQALTLRDRIENIGPDPAEMRVLYHFNFGFPVVGPNSFATIGATRIAPATVPTICCLPVAGDRFRATVERPTLGAAPGLRIAFDGATDSLPFVQVWQDPRPRRNILAIEPANCDRRADGTSGRGPVLAPGETRHTEMTITFSETS